LTASDAIRLHLTHLEQRGELPPRVQVQWPQIGEPAALYLALALIRGRDEVPGPAVILAQLGELGWLRAVGLRADRLHGIGWLAPRSIGVAQDHISQFVEDVFRTQYKNGAGHEHA